MLGFTHFKPQGCGIIIFDFVYLQVNPIYIHFKKRLQCDITQFVVKLGFIGLCKSEYHTLFFTESAHWANSVQYSRCLSVCLSVYISVRQQKQKYWCYHPHRSRDSLSPVCGIFFIPKTLKQLVFNMLALFLSFSGNLLPIRFHSDLQTKQ